MGFIGSLFGGKPPEPKGPSQLQNDLSWHNTQQSLGEQMGMLDSLRMTGRAAVGNQTDVYGQQQALANQLQQQALGAGPNPAQAQFHQNANQVAAQSAGLMGSQKGISPALQARLVAQQGAGAGQAVAGQAATLQAQQQLAAQQALMQQQGQMANLATQQIAQQQNAANAYANSSMGQASGLQSLQGNVNSVNAQNYAANQGLGGDIAGGLLGGGGVAATLLASKKQPIAPVGEAKYASGGEVGGHHDMISFLSGMAMGGPVLNGESYANQMRPVPGQAAVKGDSSKNDTVAAKLSPGEVIIPRSVMQSKDPAGEAAKFVAAVMAKKCRRLG
jgi:hypothetical protein